MHEPTLVDIANQVHNLQAGMVDLAAKVYWLYNAADLIDREDAIQLIHDFNVTYGLVELDVIDENAFDELTPEMFDE